MRDRYGKYSAHVITKGKAIMSKARALHDTNCGRFQGEEFEFPDQVSYEKYLFYLTMLDDTEDIKREKIKGFLYKPKISIIMPVSDIGEKWVRLSSSNPCSTTTLKKPCIFTGNLFLAIVKLLYLWEGRNRMRLVRLRAYPRGSAIDTKTLRS